MGQTVLNVTLEEESNGRTKSGSGEGSLRFYAHCVKWDKYNIMDFDFDIKWDKSYILNMQSDLHV